LLRIALKVDILSSLSIHINQKSGLSLMAERDGSPRSYGKMRTKFYFN
jgi:hypothetical protein